MPSGSSDAPTNRAPKPPTFSDHVDADEIDLRVDAWPSVAEDVMSARAANRIGESVRVLVEAGKTQFQGPEDGSAQLLGSAAGPVAVAPDRGHPRRRSDCRDRFASEHKRVWGRPDPMADPPSPSRLWNLPNALTMLRLLLVPLFGYLLLLDSGQSDTARWWAAVVSWWPASPIWPTARLRGRAIW